MTRASIGWRLVGETGVTVVAGLTTGWVATALSSKMGVPLIASFIFGTIFGSLLAIMLVGRNVPPSGAGSSRAQALTWLIVVWGGISLRITPESWHDVMLLLNMLLFALPVRTMGALLAWRVGLPDADLAPPSWNGAGASIVIATAFILGAFPALGPLALAVGWAATLASGTAIDRWRLMPRAGEKCLVYLGLACLGVIVIGMRARFVAALVQTAPLVLLHLVGVLLVGIVVGRTILASRRERRVPRSR